MLQVLLPVVNVMTSCECTSGFVFGDVNICACMVVLHLSANLVRIFLSSTEILPLYEI